MVASFTDAWIETRIYIRSKSKAFVASFTDAWIETFVLRRLPYMTAVASFTDAWIETFNPEFDHIGYQVASFTDAWIETGLTRIELLGGSRIFYRCVDWNIKILTGFYPITESHLLQMRGLKLDLTARLTGKESRIFYRCVDWNQTGHLYSIVRRVASFTDAWIETKIAKNNIWDMSRIFYRCVDWN